MKKTTFIIAYTLLFNLLFAQPKDDQQLVTYFDKVLSEQFKADEPGATVLVSRHGQVIYKKAFGMANLELNTPMQMDNVFWIASIGKQFTAVAILQLMEQGKLNLQDEITKFIPDYPTQGNKITIEHLLTHTSGIHNYSGMKDPEKKLVLDCTPNEVIDFFKNLPMSFAPGTKWEYSNSGYFLLGYIIEKITGKTYAEYLEENFFKPLGMVNSLYANDKKIIKNRVDGYSFGKQGFENGRLLNISIIHSAGAIQSTVEDFFKWHQAIQSYKLIKKETFERAFTRYKLKDGKEADYGYGWKLGYVYDSPSIWHGGSIEGFGSMEIYLPREDVFVTIFTNCDCNYPKDIAFWLAALASGKPYEYKEIPFENMISQGYEGVYENEKGLQRIITVSENKLYSQLGRGPKSNMKAYQKDMFSSDDAMVVVEFSRDKKGKVDKLTSKKLTGNEIWSKTNKPIPSDDGIKVDEKILESYVGEYEIPSMISFSVSKEHGKLFLQAQGQDKLEMFADTENIFFLKVNDAQFEFVKDDSGKVTKIIMNQGGRQADAKKVN
jgi:CubicO group peptidase (beta-lactamase class C family)